jgi:hypothetical protein
MKPYMFWVLFAVIVAQQFQLNHFNELNSKRWEDTLKNSVSILELRKDLDQTIYAVGSDERHRED